MRRLAPLVCSLVSACTGAPPASRVDASPTAVPVDAQAAMAPVDVDLTWLGPGDLEVAATGRFGSTLRVERRADDGTWSVVEQADPVRLRARCEDPVPATCIDLERRIPMRPAHWNGPALNSQCGLGARGIGGDLGGTVRMVLSRCDGTEAVVSPPVEALSDEVAAARAWAAGSMLAARALRLDVSTTHDAKAAPTADRLAGEPIRPGTEHELDAAARAELTTLLVQHAGYSDRLVRRCAPGPRLGIRVTRALPTTGTTPRTQDLDLAVDPSCGTLVVARGEHAPRNVQYAVFSAVRPAYVAFAKRLFPDDPEIAKLR